MGKKKKKKRFYRCGFSFIFPFFSSSDSLFSSDFFSIYLRCSNPYCRIPSIRRRSIDCQVSGTNGFFNSRSDFLSLSLSLDSLSLSLFIHKYAFLPSGYCTALLTVLLLLPSQLRFLIWPYCLSIGHKIWTEIRNLPPPRHSSKSNFRKFFFSCEGNQLPNGLFRRASVGKAIRFCFAPRFD